MPKFRVYAVSTTLHYIDLEAKNEKEARKQAKNFRFEWEYHGGIDWHIESAERIK